MIVQQPSILHSVAFGFPTDTPIRDISAWIGAHKVRVFINKLMIWDRSLQYLRYQPRPGLFLGEIEAHLKAGDEVRVEMVYTGAGSVASIKDFPVMARLTISSEDFSSNTVPRVF